jgi:putative acetyltransferase
MLIRRETRSDAGAIHALTAAAFSGPVPGRPGRPSAEARLVDELRGSKAWLPAFSLVAISAEGRIVGHVLCTRAHVASEPALALAPLSVHPDHQRQGVGSALMHAVLGAADASNEPLVALLGDPAYYRRFGFRPGVDYHVAAPTPGWGHHFQVRALTAYRPSLHGAFSYAQPFDRL